MTNIKFPALLAGPILRRVETSQIYIWVATSKAYNITAQLYEVSSGNNKMDTKSDLQTVQLGANLFIQLIKITPKNNSFPTNQLIGYNLHFENEQESFDLEDLGLLNHSSSTSIVYESLDYPTFYINKGQSSNILFGSCRKLHGEGKDTLTNGDQLVAENSCNLSKRPQALFLMGDQIYADNVADPVFGPIHLLGRALMGAEEKLQSIDKRLNQKSHMNKINGRKSIMKQIANFTSRNASNHLIEFGEYAAMYLFSWSPTLWEIAQENALFETFEKALENNHIYVRSKSDKLKKLKLKKLEKQYTDQEKIIANCQSDTYKIRRLLANTPTYMIFDDHDITDDWNINAEWKKAVQHSPLGKHIVTNGLSAYWAFQGWGNDPDIFEEDFIAKIQQYFQTLQSEQIDYHSWIDLLWEHRLWHFLAPTTPKPIFLDTRTMREYEDKPQTNIIEQLSPETYPPQLVNDEQFEELSEQLDASEWKKGSPLIVVSATPVIGFELIEELASQFTPALKMVGVEVETVFDVEAWKFNGKGLTRIFNQLAQWNPSQCIILSGDVHYGFSLNSSVTFADGKKLNIKQITSSPQKNMSFHNLGPLMKVVTSINHKLNPRPIIYRYCDPTYKIQNTENDSHPKKDYLWQEKFHYDEVHHFSIIETENNLGLLTINEDGVENRFLK